MNDLQEFGREEGDYKIKRRWTRWLAGFLLMATLCGLVITPVVHLFLRARSAALPGSPSPIRTPGPEATPINRIAYINLDRQLATIAPDGRDGRTLTDENRVFQFPAWSPDGSYLAVIGGDSLYALKDTLDQEGEGALNRLYGSRNQPPFYLYWSPDSRQVSFLANHPDGIGLHVAEVTETRDTSSRLVTVGQPFYWDWTPNGDQLLIHTGSSGSGSRLALIDPAGNGSGDNLAEPGFFQAPVVSRSGRYWAYGSVDGAGNRSIVIQEPDISRQQARAHLGQAALSWSPAADLLAFTSPSLDASAFYGPLGLWDAATGESRTLAEEVVLAYFWSPDGRSIAYFTLHNGGSQGGVQATLFDRRLSKPHRQDKELALSLRVVDVESSSSRLLRVFQPTQTFVGQFMPFFDQYALSHRLWSPASDALVLPIVEQGAPHVYVIPIDGRPAEAIAAGTIAFWSQQ